MDSVLIDYVAIGSGIGLVVSIWLAFKFRTDWQNRKKPWGFLLLGFWALMPPIWFFLEIEFLREGTLQLAKSGKPYAFDRVQYLQELARNIWIAVVVVLSVVMNIAWPK